MKLPASHGLTEKDTYSGFGRAVLEKLGWTNGKGLGVNEDGLAAALQPKRKEEPSAGVRGARFPPLPTAR